ncbi:MAG: selenocysteine-specific translation elongation factor [Planctomycetota bacterium]|nr:selenocysteine-specific translation elongation factor [Planctomycetota bacterium]
MEIQPVVPIVIGTAGHIDHGKSTLVKALTGIDPDRLKEEKERGLTIDLGFANLELPDGRRIGIVDVPGHERFIRNMVAGASGIDLVILVVAADDGVMPQTREHLQIMGILGVQRGFVALTKIDMVDADLVELAEADVREAVAGTFLADAPVVRVSAITGQGVEELKDLLLGMAAETEPRSAEGVFRMPIQRVFSKRGLGTVVTGIPVSGSVRVGDVLQVLPGGKKGKVRGLQAYHEATDVCRAGHSSAINLTDVDRGTVQRGCVAATPDFFSPQRMIAVRFNALANLDRPLTNRMPVRVHTGTADPPGEVVLLDHEEIGPGESGLVQLRLEDAVVCAPGDRFVLRLLSPMITLGGGVVLEESRYRLKRFKGFVIEELGRQELSLDSPGALLESILARAGDEPVPLNDLAVAIKRPRDETAVLLEELEGSGRVVSPSRRRFLHVDRLEACRTRLRSALDGWFAENPHRTYVDVLELRRRTGFEADLLNDILGLEERAGSLERSPGGRVRPAGRGASLDEETQRVADEVQRKLTAARFQPPSPDELAAGMGLDPAALQPVLEALIDTGGVVHVGGDLHLAGACVEEARAAVVENCERNGKLEIPELRDALGTTRKFLIPLLEYFDTQGVTLRQAGHRVLRRR